MKALEEKPLQSENEQNLPSSTTGVPSLLNVANHMKNKVKVGSAAQKNQMKKTKIPKKEMAKAKPKSKPLLAKKPSVQKFVKQKKNAVDKSKSKQKSSKKHEPWTGIPASILHKYRAGCSKCRYREFCTRSCWYSRGFEV